MYAPHCGALRHSGSEVVGGLMAAPFAAFVTVTVTVTATAALRRTDASPEQATRGRLDSSLHSDQPSLPLVGPSTVPCWRLRTPAPAVSASKIGPSRPRGGRASYRARRATTAPVSAILRGTTRASRTPRRCGCIGVQRGASRGPRQVTGDGLRVVSAVGCSRCPVHGWRRRQGSLAKPIARGKRGSHLEPRRLPPVFGV